MNPPAPTLVTGAGSGIGAAVCEVLCSRGRPPLVTDIDERAAARVGRTLGSLAGDRTSLAGAVLNAGVAGGGDILDLDRDRYRTLFAINVDGVVNGLTALAPLLSGRPLGAAITVTASIAGLTAIPFDPIYAMTKHAVIGLVRGYADHLAARGIRLQAVCPGLVDTPLLGHGRAQAAEAGYPLLSAREIADVLADCADGTRRDTVIVVQPGRDPVPYRFAGIPGPGGGSARLPERIDLGRLDDLLA